MLCTCLYIVYLRVFNISTGCYSVVCLIHKRAFLTQTRQGRCVPNAFDLEYSSAHVWCAYICACTRGVCGVSVMFTCICFASNAPIRTWVYSWFLLK